MFIHHFTAPLFRRGLDRSPASKQESGRSVEGFCIPKILPVNVFLGGGDHFFILQVRPGVPEK